MSGTKFYKNLKIPKLRQVETQNLDINLKIGNEAVNFLFDK